MSYRKTTPSDFIGRVQQGYDFWQYKMQYTHAEWIQFVKTERTTVQRANDQITLAKKLLPDRVRDFDRLREIARLQIPYDVIVDACSDNVTDEQREKFFIQYASAQHGTELISQSEAREILQKMLTRLVEHQQPLGLPIPELSQRQQIHLKIQYHAVEIQSLMIDLFAIEQSSD